MRALAVFLVVVSSVVQAEEFTGKVVSISDGDTVTVLHGETQVKVRLNGIDAPEYKQRFSDKSRDALGHLVFRKTVTVTWDEKDKYDRILGIVHVGDKNVNTLMVKAGWAWMYRHFTDSQALDKAENEAREAKRGLWADEDPTPPWEFRRQKATAE